jgi:hypothetical protein
MEEPMTKPNYYDPDAPHHLERSITLTERKLESLRLRKEIRIIDEKLKLLWLMYPPQRADDEQVDDEQPSAVHNAPSSDQEITQ